MTTTHPIVQEALKKTKKFKSLLMDGLEAEKKFDYVTAQGLYADMMDVLNEMEQIVGSNGSLFRDPVMLRTQIIHFLSYFGARIRNLQYAAKEEAKKNLLSPLEQLSADVQVEVENQIRNFYNSLQQTGLGSSQTKSVGSRRLHSNLLSFNDVEGNKHIIDQLKTFRYAPSKQSLVLYGPPGSGKTLFAQAFAQFLGLDFEEVNVSQLLGALQGVSEKNVSALIENVDADPTKLVLLDEAESMIQSRSIEGGVASAKSIVQTFLPLLERMNDPQRLIFATNYYSTIDAAIKRRLSPIFVGYPNKGPEATAVFIGILNKYQHNVDLRAVTDAFRKINYWLSPATMTTIIENAIRRKYIDLENKLYTCNTSGYRGGKISAPESNVCVIDKSGTTKFATIEANKELIYPDPIVTKEILDSLLHTPPSVSDEEYETFKKLDLD